MYLKNDWIKFKNKEMSKAVTRNFDKDSNKKQEQKNW